MAKLDFTVTDRILELAEEIPLPAHYDRMSREQRARCRDQYHRLQKGICPFCLQPLLGDPPPVIQRLPLDKERFPKSFFKWPEHLHHNHRTGLTIGAYHARCNAVLAQYLNE